MVDQPIARRRTKGAVRAVGLLAGGAIAGGVLAGTLSATASTSAAGSQNTVTYSAAADTPRAPWAGGSMPQRSDEKSVSSATAATLRAAALKAVPGGTVYQVETDAGDAGYEAHMTKADGSRVTVKFDKQLKVTKVEAGMGAGDPARGGPGGPGGPGGAVGPGGSAPTGSAV